MVLYRAILAQFPESFYEADQNGCLGYMELGIISTTSAKEVAITYSGLREGRADATVIEVVPSSACRGACVIEFSQYPSEMEYLFPACSYVEPRLNRYETTTDGQVKVVTVSITSRVRLIDEILHSRKMMHLAEFKYLIQNFESRLGAQSAIELCKHICSRHESLPPERYLNHADYQLLLTEMLDAIQISAHVIEMHSEIYKHNDSVTQTLECVALRDYRRTQLSIMKQKMIKTEGLESQATAIKVCKLKGLIKNNIQERDSDWETPILKAAADGANKEDVYFLLCAGASTEEVRFADNKTALHLAAEFGHTDIVQLLLIHRANMEAKDSHGSTALFCSAKRGHLDIVKVLVASGALIDTTAFQGVLATPLWIAAQEGHTTVIELLGRARADVNWAAKDGCTPIHAAAERGHTAAIDALGNLGADVNRAADNGTTPLLIATDRKHIAAADALRLFGATL
uniref:NAD(+)--protein-arginine ADP-ribosyltransferase n=1 Tax=Cryptomonas curvata TaxID=233186 RepID=A0A7S0QQ62_9CRYP|mmetsp:Transcript_44491/g.93060  ORF Transcript_44491/g.93060 Transcript_44491/m.93060 type:complete len:459 (+) Transcript_44491:248-1624(+)